MKNWHKVIVLWGSLLAAYFIFLLLFPHARVPVSSTVNRSIQALLFSISLFIFLNESTKHNRWIFLNFVIWFCACVSQFVNEFVGFAFLKDHAYANFLYNEYNTIAVCLFLSVSVGYIVIDLMFRNSKPHVKLVSTYAIVLVFFFYYFHPFVSTPLYLYSTEEIRQWKTLDTRIRLNQTGTNVGFPTAFELANEVKLQSWRDGVPVGDLYPEENIKRIEELTPYLAGENWQVLLYKPLYLNIIYMNVMCIGFIILFFGYQYKRDPPQGAYIDKLMFMFLLFCSMEIVHNWGYIKSLEWSAYSQMVTVGQYITVFIELLMVLFFGLRLRFITSVQGEFYETELVTNPRQVTRWRDWVDEIILAKFFNFKIFNGRLFQDPSAK